MKSQKGFTLIELSIVLVIIGIILGAVLKGQDLIVNARAKKVVNWERQWETALWTYMDRVGRFPGDGNANGVIGETVASGDTNSALNEVASANFINTPQSTITVGSVTFYIFVGNDAGKSSAPTATKNIILVCGNPTCAAFTTDQLPYVQAIDTAITGYAIPSGVIGGQSLNVRGIITASPTLTGNPVALAAGSAIDGAASWSTADLALAYWFDRPY